MFHNAICLLILITWDRHLTTAGGNKLKLDAEHRMNLIFPKLMGKRINPLPTIHQQAKEEACHHRRYLMEGRF